MSKYVRIIYLYVVSIITLCMVVVGIVGTATELTEYLCPSVYYYSEYDYGTSKYTLGYNDAMQSEKRDNLKSMFTYITVTVVGLPLFVYHWKMIQKDEEEV